MIHSIELKGASTSRNTKEQRWDPLGYTSIGVTHYSLTDDGHGEVSWEWYVAFLGRKKTSKGR